MYRYKIGIFVIVGLLLFGMVGGCSSSAPKELPSGSPEFEVIRQAADNFFSSGKYADVNISSQDLSDQMRYAMRSFVSFDPLPYYDPMRYPGPTIIDARTPETEMPDPYWVGHIPGSIHIPWTNILDFQYLSKLTKLGKVIVYSNTGMDGAQIATVLNLLGYDAYNLKWGMTSWTKDQEIAPGRYYKARDTVWTYAGSYRAICPISEPIGTHPLPYVHNTDSKDPNDIIKAAADAYLSSQKPFNMAAQDLYGRLYAGAEAASQSESMRPVARWGAQDVPYFLDVRIDDTYLNGHLCGAQHILARDVFKTDNLARLPRDKQILVYDETGQVGAMVAAALNLLGYDAINLKFGMTAWSLALPGQDFAPGRYDENVDCLDNPIVEGADASIVCPG